MKSGWRFILKSLYDLRKFPQFPLPLLIVWTVHAPTILYFKFLFPRKEFGIEFRFVVIFGIVFWFAFLILFSCSILLELLEQVERGEPPSLLRAFGESLHENLP